METLTVAVSAKDLDVNEASRLAPKLHLAAVHVSGIQARTTGGALIGGELGWKLLPINVAWAVVDSTLRIIVPVSLHVLAGEADAAKHVAEIGVLLHLDYGMDDPSEDHRSLAMFAGISGTMHAWPYVRSEIQQMSTKIGLPPLVLPPLLSGNIGEVVGVVRHLTEEPAAEKAAANLEEGRKAPAKKKKKARKAK